MSCAFEIKQCISYLKTGFKRIIIGYWYTKSGFIISEGKSERALNISNVKWDINKGGRGRNAYGEKGCNREGFYVCLTNYIYMRQFTKVNLNGVLTHNISISFYLHC